MGYQPTGSGEKPPAPPTSDSNIYRPQGTGGESVYEKLQARRCPCCGAPVSGDECEYCGTAFAKKQTEIQFKGNIKEIARVLQKNDKNPMREIETMPLPISVRPEPWGTVTIGGKKMHTLKIPRETKKTCVIVILAALLLVAVVSCAGMTILRNDAAAAERDRTPQSAAPTAPLSGAPREREAPKELLAVEEAYTQAAAAEPEPETIDVNGQICELAPASETVGAELIGTFKVTHYAPVVECCGKSDGISASGRKVIPYYTVAVDPSVIPLGSILHIDYGDGVLHEVRADDTGGLVKGYTIDLCVSDYDTAVQMGVRQAQVYLMEGAE